MSRNLSEEDRALLRKSGNFNRAESLRLREIGRNGTQSGGSLQNPQSVNRPTLRSRASELFNEFRRRASSVRERALGVVPEARERGNNRRNADRDAEIERQTTGREDR